MNIKQVFWEKLPQYARKKVPKFFIGWLDRFKARHSTKKSKQHGEAGSVNLEAVEDELQETREAVEPYDSQNIYNMDESAVFWKMTTDGTLATQQGPGGKHDKARIIITLACNVTGPHKLDPWFIGKAAVPRCFGRSSINVKDFCMVWRSNKKAWMAGKIFK